MAALHTGTAFLISPIAELAWDHKGERREDCQTKPISGTNQAWLTWAVPLQGLWKQRCTGIRGTDRAGGPHLPSLYWYFLSAADLGERGWVFSASSFLSLSSLSSQLRSASSGPWGVAVEGGAAGARAAGSCSGETSTTCSCYNTRGTHSKTQTGDIHVLKQWCVWILVFSDKTRKGDLSKVQPYTFKTKEKVA